MYVPKPDGRQRPIGVPALEDKIVQRATVAVLNQIYEVDFLDFSYGFRPGRSPHDAIEALDKAIWTQKVNWVLDADVRSFFDAMVHEWAVTFVEHRIGDKRVIRLIRKWLTAGVLEDGTWTQVEQGSPQGGSAVPFVGERVSPLCVRPVGPAMAEEAGARRRCRGAVRQMTSLWDSSIARTPSDSWRN